MASSRKPKPAQHGTEAQLLRAVMLELGRLPGVRPMRRNAGLTVLQTATSRRAIKGCEPGTPDVEVMLSGGRVVWLELKTATGRVTPTQAAWHERARAMGHTVHVVRTVDEAMAAVRAAQEVE